ncbi:copper homeostasis protein CutC [Psychromicrobium xiongbiense]|uniref:copper homeostasis protein CutC n=1 Tax=Psychromicrobium xiongbiense TaxID=3051184 RepID=UPI002556805D|nr:copper homeostasis protein CutC [Psychromicrobium sp. YIM S02556]
MNLEIAVTGVQGVRAAQNGGANRVELCVGLELGGLTPSYGLVESVLEAATIGVHALIRPRPGDFVYDADMLAIAELETASIVRQGVAGVVVGLLDASGAIDHEGTARLISVARSINPEVEVTFHRAFDQTPDPLAALAVIAELGCTRLLTSGQAERAGDGLSVLSALTAAQTGVQIMAGGGVTLESIDDLLAVGVDAVHFSAKRAGEEVARNTVSLGVADDTDGPGYFVTDEQLVRTASQLLTQLHVA